MGKKRFKMYKRKKSWVVAPIIFLGLLGAAAFSTDESSVYADEVVKEQQTLIVEKASSEKENLRETSSDHPNVSERPSESSIITNTSETIEPGNTTVDTNEKVTPSESEQTGSTDSKKEDEESIKENTTESTESGSKETTETTSDSSQTQPTTESSKKNDPSEVSEDRKDTSKKEETSSSEIATSIEKELAKPLKERKKEQVQKNKTTDEDTLVSEQDMHKRTKRSVEAPPKKQEVTVSIYRVYNPNSGEHLHTMNSYEKDHLVRLGWRYEGVSMVVPLLGRDLFRAYNPNSGEHFWTLNWNEIANIKRHGWRYEGIAWHTSWEGIPIYRVFNPNASGSGSHHYTMNLNERNHLLNAGWRNEGISWYSLGSKSRQEVLLDWFYARQGKVSYSMNYRNGPNSYDCSSAVFHAMIEAGYLSQNTWIGNTETLFSYEGKLYRAIARKEVRRGDLFIAGVKGSSTGAFGHTGIATSNNRIIHCNYTDNGIAETVILNRTGDPCYWFRFI